MDFMSANAVWRMSAWPSHCQREKLQLREAELARNQRYQRELKVFNIHLQLEVRKGHSCACT